MSLFQRSKELFAAFAVATIGLGAPAALANDTQSEPTAQSVVYGQQYASLNSLEASLESKDRILLHFGNDFPEETKLGIIEALENLGYNFAVAEGGPAGHMDLYINEIQGKKPFTPAEAIGYLGIVLEQNASQYKLANNNGEMPTPAAG